MKTIVLALLMACMTLPAVTWAQENKTGDEKIVRKHEIKVEVKDGQVFVNGELAEMDDEGRYWVEGPDGERMPLHLDEDGAGENVFVTKRDSRMRSNEDDDENEEFVWHMNDDDRPMMRFRRQMHDNDEADIRVEVERLGRPGAMMGMMRNRAPLAPGAAMEMALRMREHGEADSKAMKELMDMERELRDLGRKTRQASGADRTKLLSELDQKLQATFDRKLAHEREMLARHEEQLAQQRERLKKRDAARADIIRRHRADLLGERDGLDW